MHTENLSAFFLAGFLSAPNFSDIFSQLKVNVSLGEYSDTRLRTSGTWASAATTRLATPHIYLQTLNLHSALEQEEFSVRELHS